MAEKREINPILKLILEIGPLAVYFWAYRHYADRSLELFGQSYSGVTAATIVFVPVLLIGMLISWILTRHLPRMTIFTALMVIVFGVLTAWFNDDTFTKIRPSIIYSIFALALGIGLYVQKTNYLKYLLGDSVPLTDEGWNVFERNFMIFFIVMVVINEFTWRVLGDAAWVFLDSFGQMILTFIFMASQFPIFSKYAKEEAGE